MRIGYYFPLFLALLAATGCGRKAEEEPFSVGHIAPFTGPDRPVGEQQKRGMALALNDLNTSEVRKTARPLVVLHTDSRGEPGRSRNEAVRLVTINKVITVLGGADFASADPLALAMQPYTIPLLTPATFRR